MAYEPIPNLKGKRVIVTGASNETGPFVARAFARLGAELILTYCRDRKAARKVAGECEALGAGRAHVFQLDLLNARQCTAFIPEVKAVVGGVDILVGLAGAGGSYDSLRDVDPGIMVKAFQGQVAGSFCVARDAGRIMPDDGTGRIILVSATSSHKYSHGTYGYAKAALNELTPFLAYELAGRKITVNTIVPQLIDLASIDKKVRDKRKTFTPLGLIPHPEQIAQMCLVLCSPLFNIVTGQLITLDGGYRLRPPEDR